jgi:ssDNA-binding Zn-finger/Zn-ribbon topoisomerase 1
VGKISEECNLDVDAGEQARALHRVVRAMHDGHCPKCGCLESADIFMHSTCHGCPECGFTISIKEAELALAQFRPYLNKSVEIFEQWRKGLKNDNRKQHT